MRKKILKKIKLYTSNAIIFLNIKRFLKSIFYQFYFYKLFNTKINQIHLGSGNKKIKNFCNIDAYLFAQSDIISGVNKIILKSNSLDTIYNSHILEHIKKADTLKVLKEWHRTLKPKGILYISVPNVKLLFELYLENIKKYDTENGRYSSNKIIGIIYGGQNYKFNFHYNGFSYSTLSDILHQVGFKNIEIFDPKNVDFLNDINDGAKAYFEDKLLSLNLKATK